MSLVWRLALAHLRGRPGRAAVTVLGLCIGVAGLRAIQLGTDGAIASISATFTATAGPAALVVVPAGDTLAPLPADVRDKLAGDPDLAAILPLVAVPAVQRKELMAWSGPLLPGGTAGLLVLGVDRQAEAPYGRFAPTGATGPGVLVSESWAQERDLALGAPLVLVGETGIAKWQVGGLLAYTGLAQKAFGRVVITDLDAVRTAFALAPGTVHELDLVLRPGVDVDAAAERLRGQLGTGVSVLRPDERGKDIEQRLGNMTAGTRATSSMALFLAAFLIYGQLTIAVLERRRAWGLLRCAGATRRQAGAVLVVETILLAVPAVILGALLGVPLAHGVATLYALGANADLRVVDADIAGGLAAAGFGLLVALVTSLIPARRSVAEAPLTALRDRSSAADRPKIWTFFLGAAAVVTGAAVGLVLPPESTPPPITYGAALIFLSGWVLILPWLLAPSLALLRKLFAPFSPGAGLGALGASWRPGRSALAAGTVLVCVAMTGGTAALGTGLRDEMAGWMNKALSWDFLLARPGGIGAAEVEKLAALPGVQRLAGINIRPVEAQAHGKSIYISVVAVDAAAYADDGALVFAEAGAPAADLTRDLDAGAAFVTSVVAEQLGIHVGDVVEIQTPGGPANLPVRAQVVDYTQNGYTLFVSRRWFADRFGVDTADVVVVRASADADRPALRAAISSTGDLFIQSRDELHGTILGLVDQAMAALDLLLWLSGLVGLLAVGAALAQNVLERRADLAVFRGIGASRRQLRAMVTGEALALALLGGGLGVPAGLYLGWVFTRASMTLGIPMPYSPPGRALLIAWISAILAALLAARIPARHAAQVSPLQALRYTDN